MDLARTLRSLLEKAESASLRLEDDKDPEALHDFRVSLRRLHTLLKAYRKFVKEGGAKTCARGLKSFIAGTNLARDYEVWIEWLRSHKNRLDPGSRNAILKAIRGIESRRRRLRARIRRAVNADFKNLSDDLKRLSRGPRLAKGAATKIVRRHAQDLSQKLSRIKSVKQKKRIHKARIAVKRLRYVLELLAARPAVRKAVGELRTLQGLLGQIHDLHVLSQETSKMEERNAPLAGLSRARELMKEERKELFQKLRGNWLEGKAAGVCQDMEHFPATGQTLQSQGPEDTGPSGLREPEILPGEAENPLEPPSAQERGRR